MASRVLAKTFGAALALGALVAVTPSNAVVLQINGTVVPSGGAIQPGLNKGENGCADPMNLATCFTNTATPPVVAGAGPKGPIDRIFDAAEQPQVFAIPQTNGVYGTVEFVDLLEGAGFENSFGWYNVGDDLSDLNNLHVALSCTNPNYEATPNANSKLSINFQTEFTAGRYKGGFVGFFLVTPEGNSNCGNCGRPDPSNCVGRIYYTEKEINGDGNYVHYLIYQTNVTDAAGKRRDDFYFGFEDLYRGGDNDFEDMLIFVRGLVKPCTPSAEICDGLDNNCDGLIDNSPTDMGGPCTTIPGNTGNGACQPGVLTCASTGPGDTTSTCVGEVGPQPEACNNVDDDCDGTVDNPAGGNFTPPLTNACAPAANVGACSASTQCVNGVTTCVVTQGPTPETCNGIDDNCNGQVDDALTDVGANCTPNPGDPTDGECGPGTVVCVNGSLTCNGYMGPGAEICDGKDNDCDGQIDEAADLTDTGTQCTPNGVNVCQPGSTICVGGQLVCTGFTQGSPEVCNGIDDDCNGVIDDNLIDTGGPCGTDTGACEPGTLACVPATMGDPTTNTLTCVGAVGPSMETCDGVDNDCDGFVDEDPQNLPGVGDSCMTACGAGTLICEDGKLTCNALGMGTPEICDGIDNDCDGVIDEEEDLTDVGFSCFKDDKVLYPPCKPGVTVCVTQMDGSKAIECQGATQGTAEVCNNIDDDCNGVIDDGTLAGEGDMCLPPGVTDPVQGACMAGTTKCVAGEFVCDGGTGPKQEICNGIDDDCDGVADSPDPCPGETKCIAGKCSEPCNKAGEFTTCPGGTVCENGFCVIPGGQGGSGGGAGAGGTAGAAGAGANAGDAGASGTAGASGASGAAGSGADSAGGASGAPAGAGASGASGANGADPLDSDGDGERDSWGLTTGGGGCSCDVAAKPQDNNKWGWLAAGLGWLLLRRRRDQKGGAK